MPDERAAPGSEQRQAATATTANQNELDISEPTPERQAELRAAYEANVAAGKPPDHHKETLLYISTAQYESPSTSRRACTFATG